MSSSPDPRSDRTADVRPDGSAGTATRRRGLAIWVLGTLALVAALLYFLFGRDGGDAYSTRDGALPAVSAPAAPAAAALPLAG